MMVGSSRCTPSGCKALSGHDRGVPVAGPAFVHDLGLALRGEVIGLVADDRQHVALPGLERRMLDQEQQHVLLAAGSGNVLRWSLMLLRLLLFLGLEHFGRIDVIVHVVLALEARQLRRLVLVLLASKS